MFTMVKHGLQQVNLWATVTLQSSSPTPVWLVMCKYISPCA